jgi:hypothetical protein
VELVAAVQRRLRPSVTVAVEFAIAVTRTRAVSATPSLETGSAFLFVAAAAGNDPPGAGNTPQLLRRRSWIALRCEMARELLCSHVMKKFLVAFAAALGGCYGSPPTLAEQEGDMTIADCDAQPSPFTQSGCPKPTDYSEDDRKKKCEEVKGVALNDYQKQFGEAPDCSDGWIFGPNALLTDCIKNSDKNLCKLSATNPKRGTPGWPATNNYSQCLNDWVVYCTDTYPDTMGVEGDVCFVDELDYDKLPPGGPTAREVCQRLVGDKPNQQFPPKCDPDLCGPDPTSEPSPSSTPTPQP